MNKEIRFSAPWSPGVRIITFAVIAILVGVSLASSVHLGDSTPLFARVVATFLPLAILVASLPFIIRGYVLNDHELRVERLGWENRFALANVESVEANPDAMRWSLRLCGSGGLFGYFGWFRNRTLGTYRAYSTAPKKTVVLKLGDRTIVVTPDDPARFVEEVLRRLKPEPVRR